MSNPQMVRGTASGNAIITQEIKEALAKAINSGIDSKLLSYKKNYSVFINAYKGGVTISIDYPKYFKNRQVAKYDSDNGLLYLFFKGAGEERMAIQAQKLVIDSVCLAVGDMIGVGIFIYKYSHAKNKQLEFTITLRDNGDIKQIKLKRPNIHKHTMITINTIDKKVEVGDVEEY